MMLIFVRYLRYIVLSQALVVASSNIIEFWNHQMQKYDDEYADHQNDLKGSLDMGQKESEPLKQEILNDKKGKSCDSHYECLCWYCPYFLT
jgi:hypothetical protein